MNCQAQRLFYEAREYHDELQTSLQDRVFPLDAARGRSGSYNKLVRLAYRPSKFQPLQRLKCPNHTSLRCPSHTYQLLERVADVKSTDEGHNMVSMDESVRKKCSHSTHAQTSTDAGKQEGKCLVMRRLLLKEG